MEGFIMAEQYSTLEIDLFDNLDGVDACDSCKTFKGAYVYCPVFIHIMTDVNVVFDETGEKNRCSLFTRV